MSVGTQGGRGQGSFSGGVLSGGAVVAGAAGSGAAIGLLPLPLALAAAVGAPAAALSFVRPRLALVLLVFSIPFSSWTRTTLGQFSVTATDALVALLIMGWLARGVGERRVVLHGGPTIVAGFALFAAALLSTLTATDFSDALKELIKLAEMLAVALYAASNLSRSSDIRFILSATLCAGAAEALIGLWQFATGSGPQTFAIGPVMRAYGNFDQPNALAGYLGLLLPFGLGLSSLRTREQPFVVTATIIIAAAIVASLSRAAWLGIALGLSAMALVWGERTRRSLLAAVGIGTVLAVLVRAGAAPSEVTDRLAVVFERFQVFDVRMVEATPANWALVERMAHWQAGWAMAIDHPLVGVGPGNYEAAYPRYYLQGWIEPLGHAHNYYLNTFAELGIVGLAALLVFTVSVFVRLGQGIRRASTFRPLLLARPSGGAGSGLEPALSRAMLVAALGAVLTFSAHNLFDNMFVHGIGVQFGLIFGLIEAQLQGRSVQSGAEPHGGEPKPSI